MKITITYKTKDGKRLRRVLKEADKLSEISLTRRAIFVFCSFKVYEGFSDGNVDNEGYFTIINEPKAPAWGRDFPFDELVGWAYAEGRKEANNG